MLVISLVFGCAKQQQTSSDSTKTTVTEQPQPEETAEPEETDSNVAVTITGSEDTGKELSVTEEELDALKAGIEGINAEDLGGLSE